MVGDARASQTRRDNIPSVCHPLSGGRPGHTPIPRSCPLPLVRPPALPSPDATRVRPAPRPLHPRAGLSVLKDAVEHLSPAAEEDGEREAHGVFMAGISGKMAALAQVLARPGALPPVQGPTYTLDTPLGPCRLATLELVALLVQRAPATHAALRDNGVLKVWRGSGGRAVLQCLTTAGVPPPPPQGAQPLSPKCQPQWHL